MISGTAFKHSAPVSPPKAKKKQHESLLDTQFGKGKGKETFHSTPPPEVFHNVFDNASLSSASADGNDASPVSSVC